MVGEKWIERAVRCTSKSVLAPCKRCDFHAVDQTLWIPSHP